MLLSTTRPAYEINRGIDLAQAPANLNAQQRPHAPSKGVQTETLERLVQGELKQLVSYIDLLIPVDHIDCTAHSSASTFPSNQVLQTAATNSFPGQLSYFAPAPLRVVHRPTVSIQEINAVLGLPGGRWGDVAMNGGPVLLNRSGLLGGSPDVQSTAIEKPIETHAEIFTDSVQSQQPPIGTGRPLQADLEGRQLVGPLAGLDTQQPPLIMEESEDAVSGIKINEPIFSVPANRRRRQRRGGMMTTLYQIQQQAPHTREGRHQARAEFFRQKHFHQGPNPSSADIYPVDAPAWNPIQTSSRTDATSSPKPLACNTPLESIENTTAWPTPAELSRRVGQSHHTHQNEQQDALTRRVSVAPSTPERIAAPNLQHVSPYAYQLPTVSTIPQSSSYPLQQFATPTVQHVSPYARQQYAAPTPHHVGPYSSPLSTGANMLQGSPYAHQQFAAPIGQYTNSNAPQLSTAPTMIQGSPYDSRHFTAPAMPQVNPYAPRHFPTPVFQHASPYAQQHSLNPTLPLVATYPPQSISLAAGSSNPTISQMKPPVLNAFGNYETSLKPDMSSADDDVHWLINELPEPSSNTIRALGIFDISPDRRSLAANQVDGSRYGITIGGLGLGTDWHPPVGTKG